MDNIQEKSLFLMSVGTVPDGKAFGVRVPQV